MARLDYENPPSWVRKRFVEANGKSARYEISFRLWHPGFWLWVAKVLAAEVRACIDGRGK